jgi:putative flavoprotein involved in K+ transport
MPEVHFTVRWGDGSCFEGVSPSRAIERWIVQDGIYPRAELLRRIQIGLLEASERVRERYGFVCTAAAEVSDALSEAVGAAGLDPDEPATVERLERARARPRYPAPRALGGHVDVVVIGGGQAGLAVSWNLRARGIDHVVLERDVVASSWRNQRWDSFCLVTPNWQCRLPDHPYSGDDPDGFMLKDEIVDYVDAFAASFDVPLCEGVTVHEVLGADGGGFLVRTSLGELHCDQVVLAVGGYHRPRPPALAAELPATVTQLHSSTYRNPTSVPDGGVLVVGTGQSGAQIAEDLHLAGREVHLCVGSAPRVARFYRGRDCIAWLEDIGHYRMPIDAHPEGLAARQEPNHYMTGRDGGHDIDLRAFAAQGMQLHGRLSSVSDGVLGFSDDLPANLDAADATMDRIKDTIDRWIAAQGIAAPQEPRYTPVWQPSQDGSTPLDLAAAGVNSVVWATGFRSDWSWVKLPLLDQRGYPTHERGVCSRVPGVYVLGLPWLYTWGSGRFGGVALDAEHVAAAVADRARLPAAELSPAARART